MLALAALAACGMAEEMGNGLASADRFARMTITDLQRGDTVAIRADFVASASSDPRFGAQLAGMRQVMGSEPADSVRLTAAEESDEPGGPAYRLRYRVHSGSRAADVDLLVERHGDANLANTVWARPARD